MNEQKIFVEKLNKVGFLETVLYPFFFTRLWRSLSGSWSLLYNEIFKTWSRNVVSVEADGPVGGMT